MANINFRFKCGCTATLCYGSRKEAMKDKKKWRNTICAHCQNKERLEQLKAEIDKRVECETVALI